MELGEIQQGVKAQGQFIVRSKYNLDAKKLVGELQRKLRDCKFIAVRREGLHSGGGIYHNVYQITFSMSTKPLDGDLSIDMIMKELDGIERDVEKALRVKELAEMIE